MAGFHAPPFKVAPFLRTFGCLSALVGHFPGFRAHSSLSSHQFAAHHPQIRQRKQRDELGGVLLQTAVANFHIAELAFEHSKRMLHLGADTGIDRLGLFHPLTPLLFLAVFVNGRGALVFFTAFKKLPYSIGIVRKRVHEGDPWAKYVYYSWLTFAAAGVVVMLVVIVKAF